MKKVKHGKNPGFEYDYIDDGIYIGTNMCCIMDFDKTLLRVEKIKADISLEKERIDSAEGVDFFLWLPVTDKTPPSMNQMELGVDMLKKLVSMKIKVYVHCQFGHGRSPTLVAAYFINKGMTVKEAIDFVALKRDSIHIEAVQVKALEKYAKKIQK